MFRLELITWQPWQLSDKKSSTPSLAAFILWPALISFRNDATSRKKNIRSVGRILLTLEAERPCGIAETEIVAFPYQILVAGD